jgi:hypothetical protein
VPGDELVRVEQVQIDGQSVVLPAAIPGVSEYIAAAQAEAEADRLRPLLTVKMDRVGGAGMLIFGRATPPGRIRA